MNSVEQRLIFRFSLASIRTEFGLHEKRGSLAKFITVPATTLTKIDQDGESFSEIHSDSSKVLGYFPN